MLLNFPREIGLRRLTIGDREAYEIILRITMAEHLFTPVYILMKRLNIVWEGE